jgi:GntR family transcriptional regulator
MQPVKTSRQAAPPARSAALAGESTPPAGQTPAFSPLYQQIKSLISQSLQAGEWKSGSAIPSETELAGRYKVSQGTVRKAIDALATENLLIRRQGKGTFVATHAEQQVQYRFLRLFPEQGDLESQGPAQRQIVDCRKARASAQVARKLQLRSGDAVLQIQRVLSFADIPTILENIWLPAAPFKGLDIERLRAYPGPMYALFESEFGMRMVRAQEEIRAVLGDNEQCKLLQTGPYVPLLSVERVAYTYNDMPMELRHALYRTDRHHYRNELG